MLGITSAMDSQPPVISLDLSSQAGLVSKDSTSHLSSAEVNTAKLHVCEAGSTSASVDCALPIASAYDHHDGSLAVQRDIFLLRSEAKNNEDGLVKPGRREVINYNYRAEYIVKYNAKDSSGNDAEEVVFAVILEDHVKPVIALSYYSKTLEALGNGQVYSNFPQSVVTDNIDTSIVATNDCAAIDTHKLGTTVFTYQANDFAGVFGNDGKNNLADTKTVKYTVVDTTVPLTTVTKGTDVVECSDTFTDAGATCVDSHDSFVGGKLDPSILQTTVSGTVTNNKSGTYILKYDCTDFSGNKATTKTRVVTIKDTTFPTLIICTGGSHAFNRDKDWAHTEEVISNTGCLDHHIIQHSAGYAADAHTVRFIGDSAKQTCQDSCCPALSVATSWHAGSCDGPHTLFNTLKPGSYFVKYSCTDCNSLTTTKCRTLINEDHTKPIINIIGDDLMTAEATQNKDYIDEGASCSDQVDGIISQQVEVSGDVVDLSKVGTYRITYKCKDAVGNEGDPATRIVVIKDTTCPSCAINGPAFVKREASFPYSDLGAMCIDHIDGKLAVAVTGTFNVDKVGTYKLTYSAVDKSGNKECGAHVRTIVVQDTLKPVISLRFSGAVVHQSSSSDGGTNGEYNPAGSMMAESSAHSWELYAALSAVMGVALVGYSTNNRLQDVPVSVPV